ncbi:MAG: transcriptional regulator [Chloroflexota bacterium]|nr:MAG: transcriptional regulator [Chloroflexota bacterium]
MDGATTDATAEIGARFFRGLAHPARVRILDLLIDGEKSVFELTEHTGLAQSRISTHLGCLRACGFVSARRDGRFVYYQVSDGRIRDLLHLAREVIAENASRILACHVVAREIGI